jgi:hypothetical protein
MHLFVRVFHEVTSELVLLTLCDCCVLCRLEFARAPGDAMDRSDNQVQCKLPLLSYICVS